jgi:hypothetical protein
MFELVAIRELVIALATVLPIQDGVLLGEGSHRYRWLDGWLQVPGGADLGNTHGSIVSDSRGQIYFNTDTEQAVRVHTKDGAFVRAFGADLAGGVHGMCIVQEKDGEFLYLVHHARGIWRKMKLDGEVVMEQGAPDASKLYAKPGEFHPTSIAVVPDGDIFVADGYGLSWVHQYDHAGKYIRSFGGPGGEPSNMNCPHGLLIDKRTQPYTLLVADRENHRIQVFALDGKLVSIITGMFRRPCSMQEHDGYLAVPDLAGRVTILDRKNELVVQLGDNPDESQRAQNGVPRDKWKDGVFIAPHSAHWDAAGDLYVMDWNYLGRVNKLARVRETEVRAK